MKRIVILFLLIFSISAMALTDQVNKKQLEKIAPVMSLLSQPITKQIYCARHGYIGYQNALGGTYLTGNHGNKVNLEKAYAWTLVAYHQIKKTNNKKLIAGQEKASRFVSKKMTNAQIQNGKMRAAKILKHYEKSWPAPSKILKMKDFPAPCSIMYVGLHVPQH